MPESDEWSVRKGAGKRRVECEGHPVLGEKAGCAACAYCRTDTNVVLPAALRKVHSNGGDLINGVCQVMKVAIGESNPDTNVHAMSNIFL